MANNPRIASAIKTTPNDFCQVRQGPAKCEHDWRYWTRYAGDPPTKHRTCVECGRIEVKSIVKWKLCESCPQPEYIPAGY